MSTTYVDPKTLGLPTGTEDQAWLAAQVERIDPWHLEQGHDGAYTRALEKLALELREQVSKLTPDAGRWQFAMRYWKTAQLRWNTKGVNTPKGLTVSFDFTRYGGAAMGLQQFFDDAIKAEKGGAA